MLFRTRNPKWVVEHLTAKSLEGDANRWVFVNLRLMSVVLFRGCLLIMTGQRKVGLLHPLSIGLHQVQVAVL